MARMINADSIDFAAYLASTEHKTKVRPAADFFDEVRQEFDDIESGKQFPGMTSTKLGAVLQFRPGEVTAWTGYNGHKKSMFTSQVALDLASQSERVLLASFEMTPGKTLARMSRQCAATNRPSDNFLAEFQAWSNDRIWLFDHLGRVSPAQTIGLCHYFANELQGGHIFIDSMMMVVGSEESMDEQKQFVTDLVRTAQETQCHIHLVTHCRKPQAGDENKPPSKYDMRGAAAISDQVSNVAIVWANKKKKADMEANPGDIKIIEEPDALVIVDKQRNGIFEGKAQFWFDDRSLRFCGSRINRLIPYELVEKSKKFIDVLQIPPRKERFYE